ncbi:hypothetical protein EV128_12524 [Rhizobium azibense]|nr:hypothetical protein EV128_12524 [Rhizobium azibense]
MTNRVVFGAKGSLFGMWVSKPGFDVLTTANSNMLFGTDIPSSMQVVQAGRIAMGSGTGPWNVAIPNLGYYPLVRFYSNGYQVYLTYPSLTQIRFNKAQGLAGNSPGESDPTKREIIYMVMALDRDG